MANKKRFYTKHIIEKSLKHHIVEWSAAVLSVIGAILNASKLIGGFYIWGIANILWIWFSFKYKHYGLLVMNLIFLAINIYGIINWWQTPVFSSIE